MRLVCAFFGESMNKREHLKDSMRLKNTAQNKFHKIISIIYDEFGATTFQQAKDTHYRTLLQAP